MARGRWGQAWRIGIRTWIERDGQAVLGEGRAELLAAIAAEHSITRAAKAAGMSYRRAWNLIQAINEAAGEPLVEAAVGGKQGGGARLTASGAVALDVYQQVRQMLVEASGCVLQRVVAPGDHESPCLHIAAAISLQEALGQALAEYKLIQPTVRVRAIYGASNELADHVLAGAPADVFISAEITQLDRLCAADMLAPNSITLVAQNGLAIVGNANAGPIKKPADLLDARFHHVALAEPACPLGNYAEAYLRRSRTYDKLLPKVLHVDNSRAVLAAVASGAAQAGVAFASDAVGKGAWKLLLRVPSRQAATTYSAAVIKHASDRISAESLLAFLTSNVAQRCYHRCGLRPAAR